MKTINIFGKLVSKLKDGYVVAADQVKDETLGKTQSEINQDNDVPTQFNNLVDKLPDNVKSQFVSAEWNSSEYEGERIQVVRNRMRYRRISGGSGGQGMAIYNGYMFSLEKQGLCRVSRINGDNSITYLGYHRLQDNTSHCNSAQFAPTVESGYDFPLLYVAGLPGCYVHRVTTSTNTLVQTISITSANIMYATNINIQIGDDGHIYAFGASQPYLYCYKFRKVLPSEGDVTLTDSDIVSYVAVNAGYVYSDKPWQGGKVYNNKLYFVWSSAYRRGFWVIDLTNNKLLNDVVMTDLVTSGEWEDCDFYKGILFFVDRSNTTTQIVFE